MVANIVRKFPHLTNQIQNANFDEPQSRLLGQRARIILFGTLKIDRLRYHKFKARDEGKRVTFEYIEVFYNRIRRHAKFNNQIPAVFPKACMENLEKMLHNKNTCPISKSGPTHILRRTFFNNTEESTSYI